MKRTLMFLTIALLVCGLASPAMAQTAVGKQMLNCDGKASGWISANGDAANFIKVSDSFDDFAEGTGSTKIEASIRKMTYGWGIWTDFQYKFTAPVNIQGADDIRFKVKMIRKPSTSIANKPPSYSRGLQFTFDLYDSSAGGSETWRYQEDLDIFYTAHRWDTKADSQAAWWEFVMPLKAFRMPTWAGSVNSILDLDKIKTIGLGVHSDSTAKDSVVFLIDDIRATKAVRVGTAPLINFDGSANKWITGQGEATNKFVLSDFADDAAPGSTQSMKVDVALRKMVASWGVWTDAQYNFKPIVNMTGATDLRFWIKIVTPTANKKGIQFTIDLYDSTAAGVVFWRWVPGGYYGLYNRKTDWPRDAWFPIVIPLKDMTTPGWAAVPGHGIPDLRSILKVGFGVHSDSTARDSVVFLMDDLSATKPGDLTTSVERIDVAARDFELMQNYPNPFNPSTTIRYSISEAGVVNLRVYNTLGQLVRTLVDNVHQQAGKYSVSVEMKGLSSGVYIYELQQGSRHTSRPMTLLK